MFIKTGDGTITHVIEADELTDEQKLSVKKVSKELTKQSDDESDASKVKKSGS